MKDYSDQIADILAKLKIATRQVTQPPYTEDNKPQGLIYVDGKDEAQQALIALIAQAEREARLDELTNISHNAVLIQETGMSLEYVELKVIEDRIKELQSQTEGGTR